MFTYQEMVKFLENVALVGVANVAGEIADPLVGLFSVFS